MLHVIKAIVHLESNELGFKEYLTINEQSKIPVVFPPSLILLYYHASNELISGPVSGSTNCKYWQNYYRIANA